MSEMFDQMLSKYDTSTEAALLNATFEVMQQVVLAGLYRAGFFDKAAFYGGTCLRIFHGLKRFSEDLDFSLLKKDEDFNIEEYFPAIIAEFKALGRDVTITKKEKRNFGKVESAFLKDNTHVYNLAFQTEKAHKIKIEVDTMPPLEFSTEQKLLLQPFSFFTRCFGLSDLFAGKMHALIFRAWKNRVKGRDWYDFEWYVRNGVELNFKHLQERCQEFNGIDLTEEKFRELLNERFSSADIEMVKQDVLPFVQNPHDLDIWSTHYFLELAKQLNLRS